ncbi:MAG: SDR family NAD(P)-dependent oxidoreductase [bacterium]|nr:SDR family NAD(P)-dependent oxidoreductase [Gammaproteobacteria bacterium]
MQDKVLEGKIAIVTGAASPRGLGRAMTEALVEAGARVSMMDIKPQWLDEAAAHMRKIGGDDCVITQVVNVTSIEDVERSVKRTIDELGGLHILVNNAGVAPKNMLMGGSAKNSFWDISAEEWDRVVAVNSSGPFYMTRTVVPHMIAQGWGRIIGVTTSMTTMYRAGGAPYGPSKAAHEALIAMASRELRNTGVTANVLVPGGMTNTDMIPDGAEFQRDNMIQANIMQAPVVWLSSEASNDITGQRFIGYHWDENLALQERLEKAGAPAAWPQLGGNAIRLR